MKKSQIDKKIDGRKMNRSVSAGQPTQKSSSASGTDFCHTKVTRSVLRSGAEHQVTMKNSHINKKIEGRKMNRSVSAGYPTEKSRSASGTDFCHTKVTRSVLRSGAEHQATMKNSHIDKKIDGRKMNRSVSAGYPTEKSRPAIGTDFCHTKVTRSVLRSGAEHQATMKNSHIDKKVTVHGIKLLLGQFKEIC